MGLDIYFEKQRRSTIGAADDKRAELEALDKEWNTKENLTEEENKAYAKRYEEISEEISELEPKEEVASFRKVNFLLEFFQYEENCTYQSISRGQCEALVEACEAVLADHSLAESELPTQDGFFFGSTDYDDYYFDKVANVERTFKNILNEVDFANEVLYMYCWW